jgi:PhnB protein
VKLMAEQTKIEQLDRALGALLARRDSLPSTDPEVAALLTLAADLRDLPREEFKKRLQSDLERKAAMSAITAARKDVQTVTPYLVVERLEEFLAFLQQAFGAEEILRAPGTAGGTHVELRLDDSTLFAGSAPGATGSPIAMHLYVTDADAAYQRALAAGAVSFYKPVDQPYGDREAGVRDGFGNTWYIATHKATGHRPEGLRTATPTLHARGADSLLDFLKRALGGVEEICERSPEGAVLHASVRFGDSVVEVGEARGPIEPTAGMLLLDVPDVDATHERAVAAGAVSLEPPADQRYGARRAGVKDPHGNSWYFSAPLKRKH